MSLEDLEKIWELEIGGWFICELVKKINFSQVIGEWAIK